MLYDDELDDISQYILYLKMANPYHPSATNKIKEEELIDIDFDKEGNYEDQLDYLMAQFESSSK